MLEFDYKRFKEGVKESEKTIDEFNKKVDGMGSSKGKSNLEKLNDDSNKLSKDGLSNVEKAVESVKVKFDAFGIIGKRILEDITDSAVQAGKNLIKSLSVDQITESWKKYEDEVSAVQLLVTSLSSYIGQGSGAEKEYSNEEIEEFSYNKLEKLKWFADETSYSYSAMTNALGGFIRSGYSNVDKSVTAIEGIATAAAQAGVSISQSEELFGVWSTIISGGRMMTQQFDQLNKTYKAFTGDFKELLLEEAASLGTLKKIGDGSYQTLKGTAVNMGSMRQALGEGYITADVAMNALEKYGAVANQLNKMFEEDGIRAAEGIERLRKANEGATTDKQIQKLKDEGMYFTTIQLNAFEAAQACKTYGDAIDATKDAVSTQWSGIWKSLVGTYSEAKDLWTNLCDYLWELFVPFVHYLNKAMEFWHGWGGWDMLFSVDEEKYGAVWKLFDALLDVVGAIQEGIGRVFPLLQTFDDEEASFTDNAKKLAAYLKYYTQKIVDWVESILPSEEQLSQISDMAEGIAALVKTVGTGVGVALRVLGKVAKFVWDITEPIRLFLQAAISSLAALTDGTKDFKGTFAEAFGTPANMIATIGEKIRQFLYPVLLKLWDLFQKIIPFVQSAIGVVGLFIGKIADVASPLISGVLDFFISMFDALNKALNNQEFIGGMNSAGNAFIWLSDTIGTAISDIGAVLSGGIDNILKLVSSMTDGISSIVGDLSNVLGDIAVNIIDILWGVLEKVAPAIWNKLMSIDWMDLTFKIAQLSLRVLGSVFTILAGAAFAKLGSVIYEGISKITKGGLLGPVKDFFEGIGTTIKDYFQRGNTIAVVKQLSISFVMLAASLLVLSFIDFEKILTGLIGVGGAIFFLSMAFKSIMRSISGFQGLGEITGIKQGMGIASAAGANYAGASGILMSIGLTAILLAVSIIMIGKMMNENGISTLKLIAIGGTVAALLGLTVGITNMLYDKSRGMTLDPIAGEKTKAYLTSMMKVMGTVTAGMSTVLAAFSKLVTAVGTSKLSFAQLSGVALITVGLMGALSLIIGIFSKQVSGNKMLQDAQKGLADKIFKTKSENAFSIMVTAIGAAITGLMATFSSLIKQIGASKLSIGQVAIVAGIIVVLMTAFSAIAYVFINKIVSSSSMLTSNIGTAFSISMALAAIMVGLLEVTAAFAIIASVVAANHFTTGQILGIAAAITILMAGVAAIIYAYTKAHDNSGAKFSASFIDPKASKKMAGAIQILGIALVLMALVSVIGVLVLAITMLTVAFKDLKVSEMVSVIATFVAIVAVLGGSVALIVKGSKKLTFANTRQMFMIISAMGSVAGIIAVGAGIIKNIAEEFRAAGSGIMWQSLGMVAALTAVIGGSVALISIFIKEYLKSASVLFKATAFEANMLMLTWVLHSMTGVMDSLYPLAHQDPGAMWNAYGAVAAMIGILGAVVFAGSRLSITGKQMIKFFGIAILMKIVAKAIQPMAEGLSTMSSASQKFGVGNVWNAVGAVSAMIAASIGLMTLIGELASKNAYILLGAAVAAISFPLFGYSMPLIADGLVKMMPAVEQMAAMDAGKLWSCIGAISVLMLALSAVGGTGLVSGPGLIMLAAGLWLFGMAITDAMIPALNAIFDLDYTSVSDAAKKLTVFGLGVAAFAVAANLLAPAVMVVALAGFVLLSGAALIMQAVGSVENGLANIVETFALYGEQARGGMHEFTQGLSEDASALADAIANFIDTLTERFGDLRPKFKALLMQIGGAFNDFLIDTSVLVTDGVTRLTLSITTAVNNVIAEEGPKLITSFVGMVTDLFIAFVQAIGDALIKFGDEMGSWMQEHHTEIINSLMTFTDGLASLCKDFLDNKEYFQDKWDTSIGPAISAILTMIQPQLTTMFGGMLTAALGGIMTGTTGALVTGAISSVAGWVANKLAGIAEPIDKNNVKYAADQATKDAEGTFANWFLDHPIVGPMTPEQIQDMQTRLKSWAKMLATYNGVAEETVLAADVSSKKFQNYVDGLEKAVAEGKLDAAGKAIANEFLNAYHKTMDMHSPPKTTTKDGELTVQGLINGVKEKFVEFKDTVWRMAGEVKQVFMEALGFDQGKDASSGFNILELLGLSDKDENGNEKSLEQRFKEMLGLKEGEDASSMLSNIFGENDFNINEWIGDDLTPNSDMFAGMDEQLSAAGDAAETAEAANESAKKSADKSSSNKNSTYNNGQTFNNPQPGYTIIQNNYSPKALNSTEIYRRTKSTFAKLEGIKSV